MGKRIEVKFHTYLNDDSHLTIEILIAWSGKCPFGEMSGLGNVHRGILPSAKLLVGEMSVGEMSGNRCFNVHLTTLYHTDFVLTFCASWICTSLNCWNRSLKVPVNRVVKLMLIFQREIFTLIFYCFQAKVEKLQNQISHW